MRRNIAFIFASFVMSLSLVMAALPVPAVADAGHGQKDMKQAKSDSEMMKTMMRDAPMLHILHLAGEESVLAQQMTMYALLIAFGVDRQDNLTRLRAARETFERVRVGLRVGDEALGLPETTRPEILVSLAKLDGVWPRFDAVVRGILKSGDVQADQVAALAALNPKLIDALDEMVSAYEYYAYGGQYFSVLLTTIALAESQQMLIPKMATEYLLSAYGHEAAKNRAGLAKTHSEFARALKGLMEGDPELRVLPAPTPEIEIGYIAIQKLWAEFQPLMQRAAELGQGDRESAARVADRVLPMTERFHEVFHETVSLYHQL